MHVYVIFEHNFVIFSRFVLYLLVVAEALIVLICSYFGPKVEAHCSYKIVLIFKKTCITPWQSGFFFKS